MRIEEMRKEKKRQGLTYEEIAERAGLPVGTVQKVLGGFTLNPRYDTLLALESALMPKFVSEGRESTARYDALPRKRQGEYTYEDYLLMPDDVRVELIDGVLYDMSAPTWEHQHFVGSLFRELDGFVHNNKGSCKAVLSPFDIILLNKEDSGDAQKVDTIVQPDVMLFCKDRSLKKSAPYLVPDFVAEVLSPSTRYKDMFLKASKYAEAGVREYWIVDPKEQKTIVYLFEGGGNVSLHPFEE